MTKYISTKSASQILSRTQNGVRFLLKSGKLPYRIVTAPTSTYYEVEEKACIDLAKVLPHRKRRHCKKSLPVKLPTTSIELPKALEFAEYFLSENRAELVKLVNLCKHFFPDFGN